MADPAVAEPRQLPRGRHGLSRDEVVRSQRQRMMRAMADAMVVKGYAGTTVAEVIRRAGVSRETFYQQFGSKEACFLAAYDAAVDHLLSNATTDEVARDRARTPVERFAVLLAQYLDALASEPAMARLFLLEVHAAGPAALRRRAEAQQRFAAVLVDLLDARCAAQRFVCELVVAATASLVTSRLAASDVAGLQALHAPLVRFVDHELSGPAWS